MTTPPQPHIFISHATDDDAFVQELRIKLEGQGLIVWTDSCNLRGGDTLLPEIEQAVRSARQVIAVLSPVTVNSPWVRAEIRVAECLAKEKPDYRVIPLMLPGIEPGALASWFDQPPLGIQIQLEPGQLQAKLPDILAVLGERLPDDVPTSITTAATPVAELHWLLEQLQL